MRCRQATGTYLWSALARIDVLAAPACTELVFYGSEVHQEAIMGLNLPPYFSAFCIRPLQASTATSAETSVLLSSAFTLRREKWAGQS